MRWIISGIFKEQNSTSTHPGTESLLTEVLKYDDVDMKHSSSTSAFFNHILYCSIFYFLSLPSVSNSWPRGPEVACELHRSGLQLDFSNDLNVLYFFLIWSFINCTVVLYYTVFIGLHKEKILFWNIRGLSNNTWCGPQLKWDGSSGPHMSPRDLDYCYKVMSSITRRKLDVISISIRVLKTNPKTQSMIIRGF